MFDGLAALGFLLLIGGLANLFAANAFVELYEGTRLSPATLPDTPERTRKMKPVRIVGAVAVTVGILLILIEISQN